MSEALPVTVVPIDTLKPHPRNYRAHPGDQLDHLVASLRAHGFYRNVVVARDRTILAGHGIVLAARRAGLAAVPVVTLELDPDSPQALKVLAGDNEVMRLVEMDDRALTELLRDVREADGDLLGTGFDDAMLANLLMVTRPVSEIRDEDAAAEWVGMPDYEPRGVRCRLIVNFTSLEERAAWVKQHQVSCTTQVDGAVAWTAWWPPRRRAKVGAEYVT